MSRKRHLIIERTANVHDGQRLVHVHKYVRVRNGMGDVMGRRCPCGLYQSGDDPRAALYDSFRYDDN